MSFLKKCFCCFKKKITKITLIDKDESLPKSPTKSRKDSLFITSVNKDMESSNILLKKDNERISEMNQKLNEINNQNTKSNEVDQLDILLIPQNYVRDDEADKIKFTTRGILNFIDEIRKENNDGQWINIYKKDGLVVDYKNGSMLSDKLLLGKQVYPMSKSLFNRELSYDLLKKIMYDPDIRMRYDPSFKEFKILEKVDSYTIFKVKLHSPIFFIKERDYVDKRVEFIKDNVYYNLSTSVSNYLPLDKDAVRMITYLNLLILSQDENNYYFECYTQHDAKLIIPEKLLNITIPSRIMEWFKNYIKEINTFLEKESFKDNS